jgi:hypothetical protein
MKVSDMQNQEDARRGSTTICSETHPVDYPKTTCWRSTKGRGSNPKGFFGKILPLREASSFIIQEILFWVRSCLYVKSDSIHSCTETFFIFQEILRAKSDAGASMQCVCRPMALPYL